MSCTTTSVIIPVSLQKLPVWQRLYSWDFNVFAEITEDGDTIIGTPSITFSPMDGVISVGSPDVGPAVANETEAIDSVVQAWVYTTADNTTYANECAAQFSSGAILSVEGRLVSIAPLIP